MFVNPILHTDSYKASHFLQFPPGTDTVYTYVESRGGRWPRTLFFGLQAYLREYLRQPITAEHIDEAEAFFTGHGEPFNRAGWEHILHRHGGRLPLTIRAVPEGSVVAAHNVLVTVVNTDPAAFWLPTYVETALLRAIWYPSTVATNSLYCKKLIWDALVTSSDDPLAQIPYKLHDFGARGVSSAESAMLGGMAHLVNFLGSDTDEGVLGARYYYGATMAGMSIAASEHATITSWGRDGEADAYRAMLRQFGKPTGMFAVVSDSYDLDHAVRCLWGGELRQQVIDSGATVVIRPDSGDPTTIPIATVAALGESFGFSVNRQGFKVLAPCVRVIQGDGITESSIAAILTNLLAAGWSADNLSFGMGGGLLQQLDRDTLRFACKCSAVRVDGVWRDVCKDPATDPAKRSKRGRLALIEDLEHGFATVPLAHHATDDLLVEVYRDGVLHHEQDFETIRARAHAYLGDL